MIGYAFTLTPGMFYTSHFSASLSILYSDYFIIIYFRMLFLLLIILMIDCIFYNHINSSYINNSLSQCSYLCTLVFELFN